MENERENESVCERERERECVRERESEREREMERAREREMGEERASTLLSTVGGLVQTRQLSMGDQQVWYKSGNFRLLVPDYYKLAVYFTKKGNSDT